MASMRTRSRKRRRRHERPSWLSDLERLAALPVLDRVETVAVGDIWAERFHTTPTHELIHVLDGHARIAYRRRSFAVGPGDTFIIPAGTPHEDIRTEGENYRVLYIFFDWPRAERVIRGINPSALLRAPEGVRPHLHLMMKELESEYLGENAGAQERLRVTLLEILLALVRYCRPAEKQIAHARQMVTLQRRRVLGAAVREHLQKHCEQVISLESLAGQFGLSPFHLSRSFSQEFGISIFEMLTMIRIERAGELLKQGELSIKEVAARAGFSNSNYFAKVFRRVNGVSPTEYQLKPKKEKA